MIEIKATHRASINLTSSLFPALEAGAEPSGRAAPSVGL